MSYTDRYRVRLDRKKFQIKKLHDVWKWKSEIYIIPEDALSVIRSILGGTQVLMRKKFAFVDKVLNKADRETELKLIDKEFRKVWDVISMETTELVAKYQELELIEANDWKMSTSVSSPEIAKESTPQKVEKHPDKTGSVQKNIINTPSNPPKLTSTNHTPTGNLSNRATKSVTKPVRPKLSSTQPRTSATEPAPVNSSSSAKTALTKKRSKIPIPWPRTSYTKQKSIENSSTCVPSTCPKSITRKTNRFDTPPSRHISSPSSAHARSDSIRPTSNNSCVRSVSTISASSSFVKASSSVIPLKAVSNKMFIHNMGDQPQSNSNTHGEISDNDEEYFDALSSLDDL